MAKALPQGRPVPRRAFFGLFDADGWGWASAKAFTWLLILIVALGYVPDRAYYFVVSRTMELGILGWSPINLCPPENGTEMPCPVPTGGIVPWQASPAGADLPSARTDGVAFQLGKNILYAGGSDGTSASDATFVATTEAGSFGAWTAGPVMPAPRVDAAVTSLSGVAYLVGGNDAAGAPTDTIWTLGLDPDTNELGTWTVLEGATLPEPRSGAAVVAVTDGIIVAGGWNADGQATDTVWKSTLDNEGKLGPFEEQASLSFPVADANIAFEGAYLWLYGGQDASGAVGRVQRGDYGNAAAAEGSAAPDASGEATQAVTRWGTADEANLPVARTDASGFAANGTLYLVGGSDGTSAARELYWAVPNATGDLPDGWHHLDATDLPQALENAAVVVGGTTVFLIGGDAGSGAETGAYRASLAPEEPFFQAGLVGVVVPGLRIGGEIGQQLGYVAAAGVGTGNFVILAVIAWAFNHKPLIRGWLERRRIAKEAKAPPPA